MTVTLFGISNCGTVKKARKWFDDHEIDYRFHDFKRDGVDESVLAEWMKVLGWERLLNRAGTTFRKMPDSETQALDSPKVLKLLMKYPSAIKRPVLMRGDILEVGFSPERYASVLGG